MYVDEYFANKSNPNSRHGCSENSFEKFFNVCMFANVCKRLVQASTSRSRAGFFFKHHYDTHRATDILNRSSFTLGYITFFGSLKLNFI